MKLTAKISMTGGKPVSMLLCPPQITCGNKDRNKKLKPEK